MWWQRGETHREIWPAALGVDAVAGARTPLHAGTRGTAGDLATHGASRYGGAQRGGYSGAGFAWRAGRMGTRSWVADQGSRARRGRTASAADGAVERAGASRAGG